MNATLHYRNSSYREKLLEHLFIGEMLRYLWLQGIASAEFLRPEVDAGGYDLVISWNRIVRHIQLKASHSLASTARQNVSLHLAEKPSGCVVWRVFCAKTLELGPFLWFGAAPGSPLPDLSNYAVAQHMKANAQGKKLPRRNLRVVPKTSFEVVETIPELVVRLLGTFEPQRQS